MNCSNICMLIFGALIVAVAGKSINDCVQICPQISEEVCGYNGKTYQWFGSDCEMEVMSCIAKLKKKPCKYLKLISHIILKFILDYFFNLFAGFNKVSDNNCPTN